MYEVSLLPSEYKNYRVSARRKDKLLFIGLIAGLAITVILITSVAISTVYDNELKRAENDNLRIEEQIDKLMPVEQLEAQVADTLAQINQIAGLSPSWENLIVGIGNSIPPTVGISSIMADYSDGVGSVVITGAAFSQEEVSLLLQNLAKVDEIGEVSCTSSEKSESDNKINFEINISALTGKPYELKLGGEN